MASRSAEVRLKLIHRKLTNRIIVQIAKACCETKQASEHSNKHNHRTTVAELAGRGDGVNVNLTGRSARNDSVGTEPADVPNRLQATNGPHKEGVQECTLEMATQ